MSTSPPPKRFDVTLEVAETQTKELHKLIIGLLNVALTNETASPQAVYTAGLMIASDCESLIALTSKDEPDKVFSRSDAFIEQCRNLAMRPIAVGQDKFRSEIDSGKDPYSALVSAVKAFRAADDRNSAENQYILESLTEREPDLDDGDCKRAYPKANR